MPDSPDLFDRKTLAQRRARAAGSEESAWFLHQFAIDEVSERLKDVNRVFTNPVIIGWKAEFWAAQLGLNARCISDSDTLDLQAGEADLIIHALGLHWANDPVGQLIQMRRALRPDGLMLAVCFAEETLQELRHALTLAETEILGGISPRVAPMAELRALGGLLQRAGFALPVADVVRAPVSYQTVDQLMRDLRAMGETNVLRNRAKTAMRKSLLHALRQHYPAKDGRVAATFDLAFLAGWCPSETQQKPLRPGSAQTRLADALGVPEIKTPEN